MPPSCSRASSSSAGRTEAAGPSPRRLMQREDVATRILDPRALVLAHRGDAAHGLHPWQIVLLERDAFLAQCRHLGGEILDLERGGRVLGLARAGFEELDHGSLARFELEIAILHGAGALLETELVSIERLGRLQVLVRKRRSDGAFREHDSSGSFGRFEGWGDTGDARNDHADDSPASFGVARHRRVGEFYKARDWR